MQGYTISGHVVDIFAKNIFPAVIQVEDGKVKSIEKIASAPDRYILPGFVDAHVHIESSMLVPTEFARLASVHGTVATVSDPHEIANVCGKEGVQYMIDNSKQTPFKFFFGAPSCVPATTFETAGACLDSKDVAELLENPDIWYLTEVMNYPGVLFKDPEVLAKIAAAKKTGKPIDGHAPGLRGEQAMQYASAGITTDHECFTLDEALDKLKAGMHILIREGSAAKNYEALHTLISSLPEKTMFCSDDKHPDELVLHHINQLVRRSLAKGHDLFDVLRTACVNPVLHYGLPVGLLREGDPADFIVVDNLSQMNLLATYIDGICVAENGKTNLQRVSVATINQFHAEPKQPSDFKVPTAKETTNIRVIEAIEGQLVTNQLQLPALIENGLIVSNTNEDILKITVVNRYEQNAKPAVAFIKNFGLKYGAIASTVGHDCHNIIAVGVDDDSISTAVNELIKCKGGIAVAEDDRNVSSMPLPIAGLMSTEDGHTVAVQYSLLDKKAKELGSALHAPFMSLSFMALLVIPSLKLSDKGLFDGDSFTFIGLEV